MAAKGLSHFFQKDKTFRPKRKIEEGTLRYELHKQSKASLHSGINLKECVKLPDDEDSNDWVAVHSKFIIIELRALSNLHILFKQSS